MLNPSSKQVAKVSQTGWIGTQTGSEGRATAAAAIVCGKCAAGPTIGDTRLGDTTRQTEHRYNCARTGHQSDIVASDRNNQGVLRLDVIANKDILWSQAKGSLVQGRGFNSCVDRKDSL